MKRYTASEARKRISDVLDGAERGENVVIERKGVRFQVVVDRVGPARAPSSKAPVLEIRDPAVESGNWTWREGRGGSSFVARVSSSRASRRSR
jgi:antitoxin (DNA-binding transcriptional repressor) of toxin-antitoxin stability system